MNIPSADHSPVFCSILKQNEFNNGKSKALWKFNRSLIFNTDFVEKMKQLLEHIKQQQLLKSDQTLQNKIRIC